MKKTVCFRDSQIVIDVMQLIIAYFVICFQMSWYDIVSENLISIQFQG